MPVNQIARGEKKRKRSPLETFSQIAGIGASLASTAGSLRKTPSEDELIAMFKKKNGAK